MEELPSKLTVSGAFPADVEEESTAEGDSDVVEPVVDVEELMVKGKEGEEGLSLPSA